jgi:hypothetical protein
MKLMQTRVVPMDEEMDPQTTSNCAYNDDIAAPTHKTEDLNTDLRRIVPTGGCSKYSKILVVYSGNRMAGLHPISFPSGEE